ncbi:methyl-accepting chemotaxis protein [Thalassomonas viridans]|nr:methyl-accepting chemotaxis protein [Thalassomonas viridans]
MPLVLTVYFLTLYSLNSINFSQKEIKGIQVLLPTVNLLKATAVHRGTSAGYLSGNQSMEALLPERAKKVDDLFSQAISAVKKNKAIDEDGVFNSEYNALLKQWESLKAENTGLTAAESVKKHNAIVDSIIGLIVRVSDASNLTLDSETETYYLYKIVAIEVPHLTNNLGIARAVGSSALTQGELGSAAHDNLFVRGVNVEARLKNIIEAKTAIFKANESLRPILASRFDAQEKAVNDALALIKGEVLDAQRLNFSANTYFDETTKAINLVVQLSTGASENLTRLLEERIENEQGALLSKLLFIVAFVILGLFLAYAIITHSVRSLQDTIQIFDKIGKGHLDNDVANNNKDEFGMLFNALGGMQTTLKNKDAEVGRMISTIQGMSSSLMMADTEGIINYLNPSMVEVLNKRKSAIQKVFPDFSVDNIIGSNLDSFHKNPAHQRQLLKPDNLPYTANIKLGELSFELKVVALFDANKQHLGLAVEWIDMTEVVNAQDQIATLIEKASRGDLTERIDAEQFEGFMLTLGNNINSMLDTIVEPISRCRKILQDMASGNLSQSMEGEYQGAFAELQSSINSSINNIRKMVDEIRNASSNVFSSSREIAAGNNELSHRTESQASSLEETASAMEQLTSTVQQNAESSSEVSRLSSEVMESATNGGKVVENAITAMKGINKSSNEIADIIGVIDEIAFQTNLLALNAAVEAARAGEQGRGFAVVAAEVRSLAQRSAAAAKDIKGLINDSVEAVGQGSKYVNDTGTTFNELVAAIEKVSLMIRDIEAAGKEQAAGISEVSAAVSNMDEMTQQNAALVEEASASSKAMEEQAEILMEQVNFFNNDGSDESAPLTKMLGKNAEPSAKAEEIITPRTKKLVNSITHPDPEWEEF